MTAAERAEADDGDERRGRRRSPMAARAGSQMRLSGSGAAATNVGDCRTAKRFMLPKLQDGDGLDADDEAGADDAGDDLRDRGGCAWGRWCGTGRW